MSGTPWAGIDARWSQGVQQGDHNVQHNYFAAPVTTWPVRVGVLPPQAHHFQQRPAPGGSATRLLTGMGGVGKSQMAAAIAREAAPGLDLLIWVTASSRTSVVDTYALAAAALGRPQAAEPAEVAATWLLAWLGTTDRRWMVVLDDAMDPADLRGLWPAGPNGQVVVTTRRADAALRGHGRQRVDVGVFTPAESLAFLRSRLETTGEGDELRELAADLGHLPLALAQAATFVADRGETCAGYRKRLADRRRTLADLFPDDALADDYAGTVAATWSISVDHADALAPRGLSRPLLELLSLLDPNGIPADVAAAPAVLTHLGTPAELPDRAADDALRNLARLSLLTLGPGHGAIRVHALVQRAALDHLTADRRRELLRIVAEALVQIWPDADRDAGSGQSLRANAAALVGRDDTFELWCEPGTRALLWRFGRSIGESGDVTSAVAYWERVATIAGHVLGADHPSTLSARYNTAAWTSECGRPGPATELTRQVLPELTRVLGADHADVADARNLLARLRGEEGDPAGAVAAIEELLAEQTARLGTDAPAVLRTRYNLAGWRGEAGDVHGALATAEELLRDLDRVADPEPAMVLDARALCARWRGELGDTAAAVAELREVAEIRTRMLGPDSPVTLMTRADLAWSLGSGGRYAEAATAMAELVEDCRHVLGPEHHITLTFLHHQLRWQGDAGDPAGAARSATDLASARLRVLGPNHLDTLAARASAADWRGAAGDPTRAADELRGVLDDQVRLLGPEHPHTLENLGLLAWWQGSAGRPGDAVATLRELIPVLERVHGADHPAAMGARHNLVRWLGDTGAVAAAIEGAELLRADRTRVLGAEHLDTLAVRHNLADLHGHTHGWAAAAAEYDVLLADHRRILGGDHPATLAVAMGAANAHGAAGDLAEALARHRSIVAQHLRILAPDHPRTLLARANLAHAHGEAGDVASAAREADAVLADCLRVLGPNHPDSAFARDAAEQWRTRDSKPPPDR